MRDDVTMKNTHPLQESVTASQVSQVNAETNGNADTEVEKQTISFSANPSAQWQATRDVEVVEEKKASRAFGMPPNAEESGGSPNPLDKHGSTGKKITRKRSKNLSIHLTPKEKDVIVTGARKAKKTVTDFILDSVRGAEFIVCDDLHPMLLEEKRIGNNINQIARKINSGEVQTQNFEELARELKLLNASLFMIVRRFYGDS